MFDLYQHFHYQVANTVKLEVETAGAVGIDLGASYICLGVVKDDKVEIIVNDRGNKTTPAYISFRDHPTRDPNQNRVETVIGEAAKEQVNILGKC